MNDTGRRYQIVKIHEVQVVDCELFRANVSCTEIENIRGYYAIKGCTWKTWKWQTPVCGAVEGS